MDLHPNLNNDVNANIFTPLLPRTPLGTALRSVPLGVIESRGVKPSTSLLFCFHYPNYPNTTRISIKFAHPIIL